MERGDHSKRKKTQLGSTHHERVQVALSINKVMVDPLVELLQKAFQNISDGERNWKFIKKLMNLIKHLHLKTIEICQEKSYERNFSNEIADLKKWMKKKFSKDRIKVKTLHCDGPLQIGCSVNMNNQLADGKMADPGTCDDVQESLSGQLPGHNASFEQTASTCRAEMFGDHVEPEADNGLSIINNNDGDTELKEGIVLPVENCKGSSMCEDNIETVSLDDIDDGGAVCEDFPQNPSFPHRFMGLKMLKLFENSPYSSTEESFSKNCKAEDNVLLQDVDLQSDLSKRDTSIPVLNENFDLKNEDEVNLRGDTLSESVGLKIEKKVKLKEDGTLNVTVGLKVEDGAKLKEDDTLNVIVGLKVKDEVKLKDDNTLNVIVGLKVEDEVKLKEDVKAVVLNIVGEKMVRKAKIDLQLNFSNNIPLKKKIVVTLNKREDPVKGQNSCSSHYVNHE